MLCAKPGMLGLLTSPAVEIAAKAVGVDHYVLMTDLDAERLMQEIEPLLPAIPRKELANT